MKQIDIIREQLKAFEDNKCYALVTITDTDGSATRTHGKMMVFEDGHSVGTVGGGAIEMVVIHKASECVKTGVGGLFSFDLNNEASEKGAFCGGAMNVFIEVFGKRPTLVMCGAGHVGAEVMPLARYLGFEVILVDIRDEKDIPYATKHADKVIINKDVEQAIKDLDIAPGAYFVLAGPNHDIDCSNLAGALTKDAKYIGMIGGPRKYNAIFEKLEARGFTKEQLSFVHTPIGLDVSSEVPNEIAISIMAEVLMVKNGKDRAKV